MKTPILGGYYIARSTNLALQICCNLFPTTVETKSGKEMGALYATPGLDLLATLGTGPIRAISNFVGGLVVVSGNAVYTVNGALIATLAGTITTKTGPVSIINNGTQVAIFDGQSGFLLPGGFPLSGGTIGGGGGSGYAANDLIVLQASNGGQNATAEIEVTTVSGGAVTAFSVVQTGVFNPQPTSFVQESTTGSGTGFTLTSPTFGSLLGLYTLTLPFVGPVLASYQDGFGLLEETASQIWWQSNLFDLSFWAPLNFSSADSQPDNIVGIADLHEEQFIFKERNIEVWINAGLPGFAFQRLAGVHIEMGCAAAFSIAKAGESLIWVSQNAQGVGGVHQISGYEPKKISTKAIDKQIQSYSTISDAVAYAYQQDGHLFYVVSFPTGNATWVYDATESAALGYPAWHQRASFANGMFGRHLSNCYASFNNQCVVGDFMSGNLYAYDMDTQTDNGTPKKWVRSWRALAQPTLNPMTFSALQIDMETGIEVPDGTNPQVVLRWSDDGGHNWSNERFQAAGATGKTAQRVIFKRLGSTRLNSGLDRIFELSSTDPFMTAILAADIS